MTSCEPKRSSAYDEDLRWRMVWQKEAMGYNYEQVARNLCVDKATVCRTVALFHATGRMSKRSYPKEKAIRKLTVPAQLLILQIVLENPGIFLHQIQEKLKQFLLLEVSNVTIHRCLKAVVVYLLFLACDLYFHSLYNPLSLQVSHDHANS